jgi:hypothetical protein
MPTAVLPCRIETGGQDILQLTMDELRKQSYFDSTEAEVLFNPSTEDETVLDAIDRRMLLVILAFFKRKPLCRNWERLLEL